MAQDGNRQRLRVGAATLVRDPDHELVVPGILECGSAGQRTIRPDSQPCGTTDLGERQLVAILVVRIPRQGIFVGGAFRNCRQSQRIGGTDKRDRQIVAARQALDGGVVEVGRHPHLAGAPVVEIEQQASVSGAVGGRGVAGKWIPLFGRSAGVVGFSHCHDASDRLVVRVKPLHLNARLPAAVGHSRIISAYREGVGLACIGAEILANGSAVPQKLQGVVIFPDHGIVLGIGQPGFDQIRLPEDAPPSLAHK